MRKRIKLKLREGKSTTRQPTAAEKAAAKKDGQKKKK